VLKSIDTEQKNPDRASRLLCMKDGYKRDLE
jgi:hypothetical protein